MRLVVQLLSALPLCGALTLVAAGTLACESDNRTACQEYVDYFTSLPCAVGVDPGVDCNAFADYPCPVPGYFRCLRDTQRCENDQLYVCQNVEDPTCAGKTLASCADELDCSG